VRLIGIDTPEVGQCFFAAAKADAVRLAERRRVVLRGDPTQATRDIYGRLLAYVDINGRVDLGARLVALGAGRVYVYQGRPFLRIGAYRGAERQARESGRGQWAACPASGTITTVTTTVTTPPPPTTTADTTASTKCDASYPTVCIPPPPPDLNCRDVPYRNFKVLPPDPHGFDGDHDGIGCET
jgi:micrococcal nuclease